MEPLIIFAFGVLTMVCANRFATPAYRERILQVMAASFIARVLINAFISRSVAFFSHGGAGGDCGLYELYGMDIARVWEAQGVSWLPAGSTPELSSMQGVELISHFLAVIIYLCGGRSTVTSTAGIAFFACLLCLLVYHFCLMLGASERAAFKALLVTTFGPSFLYHTSDTYKDGLNALLVVTTVCLAISFSRKASILKIVALVPVLWALWHIRPYMVFMSLTPIPIGFIGLKKGNAALTTRNILAIAALGIASMVFIGLGASGRITAMAQEQFERGTSETSREYNVYTGGSGVTFDDGGNPWASIGPKLLYTIASPFPWMGGSVGLQIGKVDALIWYYIMFSAYQAARLLWRRDKPSLLMLLIFVAPATLAYALTMANVGLILRQRMPIMIVTTVLASVYWTHQYESRRRRGPLVSLPTRARVALGSADGASLTPPALQQPATTRSRTALR